MNCTKISEESVRCNGILYSLPEEKLNYHDDMFWVYLGVYFGLVLFAGLMSGLTMGLLSLDILSLKVLERGGKPEEKRYAAKILPLVEKHHLLLVTLLLANAAAVEAMPIFMDRISSPVIAICVSVTAVLFFGEVIPQALCTRYGLAIGATLAPLVKILMVLLFIIAWPVSKLLDCLLGHEHATFFRRAELKELVDLHREAADGNEEPLREDEVLIIKGALEMRNKTVKDTFTPMDKVYMVNIDAKLDEELMEELLRRGHSRVPVYEGTRNEIVGLLLVKNLIKLDPDDATPVRDVYRNAERALLTSNIDEPLFDLLDKFQTGKSHMCVVQAEKKNEFGQTIKQTVGIVTLEDLIEQLIQEEIWDETDPRVARKIQRQVSIARLKTKRALDSGRFSVHSPTSSSQGAIQQSEEAPSSPRHVAFAFPDSGNDRQPLLKD